MKIDEICKPLQLCLAMKDHLIKLVELGHGSHDVIGLGAEQGLRPPVGQPGTAPIERQIHAVDKV